MPEITIPVNVYNKLARIAEVKHYLHKESAAILLGEGNVLTDCEVYHSVDASAGVVIWNSSQELAMILNREDFRGIFHSHLFSSCSMSGTDYSVINGLNRWSKNANKPKLFSIIGAYFRETFGIRVWQMGDEGRPILFDIKWLYEEEDKENPNRI